MAVRLRFTHLVVCEVGLGRADSRVVKVHEAYEVSQACTR